MKRVGLAVVVVLGVALLAAAVAFWQMTVHQTTPFRGYAGEGQFVEVPQGAGPSAIGARLVAAGVVHDKWSWWIALRQSGRATRLKAGEYYFDRPMTPAEVIDKLVRGDVYLRAVTFPEGLTARQMARIYEDRGLGTASAFLAATRRASLVADIDAEATDLEGYLFPDTYTLTRSSTADDLVEQMVGRFRTVWTEEMQFAASRRSLSARQAITLASLVEKETARADERPVVAAVYHNRLRIKMGLQCDPTVIYALERVGRFDGNLKRADLAFDSPYNTYRYAGLPPGPIANPGQASIAAALHPAAVDYVYFVSRNDGSHAFSATLAEHNRNVHKFQVEYFRAKH
jgi:UPF0755 protein